MKASRVGLPLNHLGPLVDCYQYFHQEASKWLVANEASEQEITERAKALLTVISDKLQVVAIHLTGDENQSRDI